MLNGFKGKARKLDDIDIPRIGQKIGVGEDELHAFMDVETGGSGFDSVGRPKMLFEPHIFYRNLSGAERRKAVELGLAYRRWGEKPYPRDSYPVLWRAMQINERAALRSASWGLGQILGENHKKAGYSTVEGMILDFMEDEENHLAAIVEFLISSGIGDDLKKHKWDTVARVYNGPGYAKHKYNTRMAEAYRKWAKIPDTPLSPVEPEAPATPARPVLERKDFGLPVEELQKILIDKGCGYVIWGVNGYFGFLTEICVKRFQRSSGLVADGIVGPATWAKLLENERETRG